MPKNKKPHANTVELRKLIELHGIDAVMNATGYKLGTLNQYIRDSGAVIPTVRLNIAKQVLASKI